MGFFGPTEEEQQEERDRQQQQELTNSRKSRGRAAFARSGGSGFVGPADYLSGVSRLAAPHYEVQQDMIDDVSKTLSDEMDSRVAQSREQRRMEHEQEMERIRQEAILARLQQQQTPTAGGHGVYTFINGSPYQT